MWTDSDMLYTIRKRFLIAFQRCITHVGPRRFEFVMKKRAGTKMKKGREEEDGKYRQTRMSYTLFEADFKGLSNDV